MDLNQARQICESHLAQMAECFKPHCKVTFLMRNPAEADGDVIITNDTLDAVGGAVAKLHAREKAATHATSAQRVPLSPAEAAARGDVFLPLPVDGEYRYRDGSRIWKANLALPSNKWCACWADHTPLRGDNDAMSYFDTAQDAARALAAGGEGPAAEGTR